MSGPAEAAELPRILVVDDDVRFRKALRLALSAQGHATEGVGGGAEALEVIAKQAPDVILLDWRMPGMSGGETCRAIRARSGVPVIVISSDRSLTGAEVEKAGGNDFLPKPFSIRDLLTHIQAALGP